ncbi:hypothetical protein Ocin01_01363, partial [Orchesella cincta]
MRFSLGLLLLAAVYIAVDAQYYLAYDDVMCYPVTLVSPYSVSSEASSELGRTSVYLTELNEPYYELDRARQGFGGGSGGGGYGGGGGGKKKSRGKGKGKKGKKGKKKGKK